MSKTKILVVDDHKVVIEGIKSSLSKHPDFEVVGEAHNGRQAVNLAKTLRPDIVIMDISMPNLNGMEATRQIKKLNPDIGIVVFTMHADKEFVVDLFKTGVSAYVLKKDPVADLMRALEVVRHGGSYFSTMAPEALQRHIKELEDSKGFRNDFETLSLREREIFLLLADGYTVKDIASQLYLSPKTVESHKYNIIKKLKVQNVTDLTKIAIKKKLITV